MFYYQYLKRGIFFEKILQAHSKATLVYSVRIVVRKFLKIYMELFSIIFYLWQNLKLH